MKRIFGVKIGEKYVAFDELGFIQQIAESPHMLETKGCERRGTQDLMRYGWRPAARLDEIDVAERGAAWALAPGAPFGAPISVRLLGAVIDKLAELRRAQPWTSRRFPLDVSVCTAWEGGERSAEWLVCAPDPTALVLQCKRVEIAFACDPWADAEHGIPHVTRTRNGRLRRFKRNDELVELEAVLDVALQTAEGAEEGLLGAHSGFLGDFASASTYLTQLWARRA